MLFFLNSLPNLLSKSDIRQIVFLSLASLLAAIIEVSGILIISFLIINYSSLEIFLNDTYFFNYFISLLGLDSKYHILLFGLLIMIYISVSIFIFLAIMKKVTFSTQRISRNIKTKMIEIILMQSWTQISHKSHSENISKIVNDTHQTGFAVDCLLRLLSKLWLALLIFIGLLLFNPIFTAILALILISSYVLIFFSFRSFLLISGQEISKASDNLIKELSNMLGFFKEIIFYNTQSKVGTTLFNYSDEIANATAQNLYLTNIPRFLVDALILGILVVILIFFSFLQSSDTSFLSTVSIYGLAAIKILPAFQNIFYYAQQISAREVNFQNLLTLASQSNDPIDKDNGKKLIFNNEIIFKNIHYSHKSSSLFFNDINCTISSGDKIALLGRSGSGKSTFIDLLLGIISPDLGSISIDQSDISQNIISYRENFAYISQKAYILEGTLRENLLITLDKNLHDSELIKLINQSGIDSFFDNFKDGLDSLISETNQYISGGEKQCLAFARAFAQKRPMLVIDEGTASMDQKLASKIMRNTLAKYETIICSTHQAHMLEYFTKAIIFENGRITAIDTIDNLKQSNAFVQNMLMNKSF
jgi:ATP-binding cassette, subfamily B, bacterial PglK